MDETNLASIKDELEELEVSIMHREIILETAKNVEAIKTVLIAKGICTSKELKDAMHMDAFKEVEESLKEDRKFLENQKMFLQALERYIDKEGDS